MARKQIPAPKKKRKQKPERGTPTHHAETIRRWKALAEKRGALALEAFNYQDEATQEVLSRMRDRLMLGANGLVQFRSKEHPPFTYQAELEYIEHNALYVAVEILKDMALMDVKIANYKFPPIRCVECEEEIAGTPRPKRKIRK